MTVREQLNRGPRRVRPLGLAGATLFIAGMVIGVVHSGPPILALVLPGFALAFVAAMYAQFVAFRCGRCRGNLGPLVIPGSWSVDRRVRFCPFCGIGLDEELTHTPTADAAAGSVG